MIEARLTAPRCGFTLFARSGISRLGFVGLAVALLCACEGEAGRQTGTATADEFQSTARLSEATDEPRGDRILETILRSPRSLLSDNPSDVAAAMLEALYRDADLASVIDAFDWSSADCRVGTWLCSDLGDQADRTGALLALVPSEAMRPTGMAPARFQAEVAPTLEPLAPGPDKAMPYVPGQNEALFRYRDHHGLRKFLLLERVGEKWRPVALGRDDQLPR